MEQFLSSSERIDDLGVNNLKLIQNSEKYCFNTDTVLLCDFVETRKNDVVCDFGTGSGIIPILLLGKRELKHVYAVEIQEYFFNLAKRNLALNNFEDKCTVINSCISNSSKLIKENVNVIVCNPPYFKPQEKFQDQNDELKICRHEILINLEGIIKSASSLLKTGGRFYIVHKAERIQELCSYARNFKLGVKKIRFVHPKPGLSADSVLIEFQKDSTPQTKILDPLFIMDERSNYTQEINKIYETTKK